MVVLDSSAAVDYLLSLDERGAWVRSQLSEAGTAIAPHLLDLEVTSFLRREVSRMKLSEARATEALADLASMRVVRYAHRNLLPRIWELRDVLTPYDASFVALAENTGLPLLTTDLRLARSHGHHAQILTP